MLSRTTRLNGLAFTVVVHQPKPGCHCRGELVGQEGSTKSSDDSLFEPLVHDANHNGRRYTIIGCIVTREDDHYFPQSDVSYTYLLWFKTKKSTASLAKLCYHKQQWSIVSCSMEARAGLFRNVKLFIKNFNGSCLHT